MRGHHKHRRKKTRSSGDAPSQAILDMTCRGTAFRSGTGKPPVSLCQWSFLIHKKRVNSARKTAKQGFATSRTLSVQGLDLRQRAADQPASHEQDQDGIDDGEAGGEDHQISDREPKPRERGRVGRWRIVGHRDPAGRRVDVLALIAGRAVVGLDQPIARRPIEHVERRLGLEAHPAEHGTAPRIESRDTDSDRMFILGAGGPDQSGIRPRRAIRRRVLCEHRRRPRTRPPGRHRLGSVLAEHPTALASPDRGDEPQ